MEPTVVVLITTGGRPDYLRRTIESVRFPDGVTLRVAADTDDPARLDLIRETCPGWKVHPLKRKHGRRLVRVGKREGGLRLRRRGYCEAVAAGIDVALASGEPWVFWLEDDFEIHQPVPVEQMQAVMRADRTLAQMALLRQPWYPYEVAAGSIYATAPGEYVQRDGWVAHRRFWTMNPHLARRTLYAEQPWPTTAANCELAFGDALKRDPAVTFGLWGDLTDPPRVEHLGVERAIV